jgi:uncharacterized membrane protein YfhO
MAYRAYLLRDSFKLWQIIISIGLAAGLLFCTEAPGKAFWAYNGIFLAFYLLVLILPQLLREKPTGTIQDAIQEASNCRTRTFTLCCVIIMELSLNILNMGVNFTGTTITDYPRGTSYTASIIRYMKERENDNAFYRAETTHSQTLNDGALNGYHGISTFTSSANVRVTEFMQALGYGAKNTYNRYCFEESSPVANLFLNLKYMLERQNRVEENNYFTDLHSYGKVHLLKNNAYLPLGFMTKNQILNVDFPNAQSNAFLFQNQLINAATGISENVWSLMDEGVLEVTATDVTIRSQNGSGYCSYSTADNVGGTLVYTYTIDRDGFMCIDLDLSKRNNFSVWKNGIELYNETYSIPQSLSVAQVAPGDVIEIHLTCKSGESGSTTIYAGVLDDVVFQEAYQILNKNTLTVTNFKNTRIEGTVSCDEAGVLYTSIPQDGNWRAIVDGKPVDTALVGDAMVALLLPEGEHEIVFKYKNDAFSLGWKVSLFCLIAFVAIYKTFYTNPTKKKKLQ